MTLGDRVALLRKGELQQVGPPRELYERPLNMFVAGFIGSPPMNFVPATIAEDEIQLPFVTFTLPSTMREHIGDREHVMVGIRPERFEDAGVIDADKAESGVVFDAHIDVVEWLGNEQYAYIPYEAPESLEETLDELERDLDSERMRSQLVVALDPSSTIDAGTSARIWFDPRRMHVFDVGTGANLTNPANTAEPVGVDTAS
jgi:multiple sugar transport system ATP-binding protein